MSKEKALTQTVKHLFNTIGAEDILKEKIVKGQLIWTMEGKEMPDAIKKLLISEAQIFLKTRLWDVLQKDIKYRANKAMFEKAKTEADITAGKLWLYTLDCLKTRLESLVSERGAFNDDAR